MKVVRVSTTDDGGAYKAALRINQAMTTIGVKSELFVRTRIFTDSPV